jgi:hypothetical protein
MFAETHTRVQEMWGGGGGKWGGAIWWPHVPKSPLEHTIPEILQKSLYYWSLDSERAGSRTLEKFSRRDRDRDCAKFESSRRFRGSNMNPKKKSRRYRASVSIQALDLAISRFTNSLALKS